MRRQFGCCLGNCLCPLTGMDHLAEQIHYLYNKGQEVATVWAVLGSELDTPALRTSDEERDISLVVWMYISWSHSISNCYLLLFLYFKYFYSRSRLSYSLQVQQLPFHQGRLPFLSEPASVILKEAPNQRNKPGCLRSSHVKELLHYGGSTYIHKLFFKISVHPCVFSSFMILRESM